MKAWILHGINDLRFEEADAPIIGENEVLLARSEEHTSELQSQR